MDSISLSQLGLYNPQRLNDEAVEALFVIRRKYFDYLFKKIVSERPDSIPQHYLIIAQRGMGKTTILKRIEVELRKDNYFKDFIPLLLPEEQYNLKTLAEFWLNILDALADTLEQKKLLTEVSIIDDKIREIEKIPDNDEQARIAHHYFNDFCLKLKKRPVLLIDNMSLIFDRLSKQDQHVLRSELMKNNAPVLVGASVISIDDTITYGAPFYDAFSFQYLQKLSFEELIELLKNLARVTDSIKILPEINEEIARLKTIHILTDGNPRTAVMLFKLIVKGFTKNINDDLEGLLDEVTPIYKARFEELSTQLQIIVDAIALNWEPVFLEQLRTETGFENNQLSPQLKRLEHAGWIEKIITDSTKANAYQISERFFNIWFLMRRSSRRQKRELYALSRFLEIFYGDEIENVASKRLANNSNSLSDLTYNLALSETLSEGALRNRLSEKAWSQMQELAADNVKILLDFEAPENVKIKVIEKKIVEYLKYLDAKKYKDAENILLEINSLPNTFISKYIFNDLGNLYQNHLKQYEKAEQAYKQAIAIDDKYAYPWNNLGNLYLYHLKQYEKAEQAYLKAIALDDKFISAYYNLVFLYRDKMNKIEEAGKRFDTIQQDKELMDSYWLNKTLFELYKENRGIAKTYFKEALAQITDGLPLYTQDDWWRFGAVVSKLGFANWATDIMIETGHNTMLAPYFIALKAMNANNPEGFLNSKAAEMREPAKQIIEKIRKFMDYTKFIY